MNARTRTTGVALLLALALTASVALSSQTINPWIGTWKLDVAKSKFNPGPPPKSRVVTIEAAGEGTLTVTTEAVDASGTRTVTTYTGAPDETENPIIGTGAADTVSTKRLDGNSVEQTFRKGGEVVATSTSIISADGYAFTSTGTGTNAQGQPTSQILVYLKQ